MMNYSSKSFTVILLLLSLIGLIFSCEKPDQEDIPKLPNDEPQLEAEITFSKGDTATFNIGIFDSPLILRRGSDTAIEAYQQLVFSKGSYEQLSFTFRDFDSPYQNSRSISISSSKWEFLQDTISDSIYVRTIGEDTIVEFNKKSGQYNELIANIFPYAFHTQLGEWDDYSIFPAFLDLPNSTELNDQTLYWKDYGNVWGATGTYLVYENTIVNPTIINVEAGPIEGTQIRLRKYTDVFSRGSVTILFRDWMGNGEGRRRYGWVEMEVMNFNEVRVHSVGITKKYY